MQNSEYKNIYANEQSHFYYIATHNLIFSLISRYSNTSSKLSILDAGCGTGLLGQKLSKFGNVIGIDSHPLAVSYTKKRGASVVKGNIESLPFSNCSFDIVTCIDVLYHKHVSDDKRAIKEFFRVLKPGGVLVLRVPAFDWLYTRHDVVVQTRRRYYKQELHNKLNDAGLDVKKLSYIHLILLLPAILGVLSRFFIKYKPPVSSIGTIPSFLNRIVVILLTAEVWMLKYINIPCGVGLVAVAAKKQS
jgi:SAM-dependent methyltransferase